MYVKSLQELIEKIPVINREMITENPVIQGITYDSRQVKSGDLFVCICGEKTDGHLYIHQALANGAVALVTERPVDVPVPFLQVADSRRAAGLLADIFYDQPTQKMRVLGVTGTNGKTTTTYLLEAILQKAGKKAGLTGTNRTRIGGQDYPVERTTPEGIDLQSMAAAMVAAGDEYLVMEVSSHALALERVAGCEFDTAVFTNLTRDHLDFHKTEAEYLAAKTKLFAGLAQGGHGAKLKKHKSAVINLDDPAARYILARTHVPVMTYSTRAAADLQAKNIEIHSKGCRYTLVMKDQQMEIDMKITGMFNVYNSMGAIGAALAEGITLPVIAEALETFPGVPGRFQLVEAGQSFAVIVDYAHTPDGLENILKAARQVTRGRIITVFGCGGDRDRTKRPIMGDIAGRLSDLAIVTSDNPRSEDPEVIIQEVEVGLAAVTADYKKITDRRQAITFAIQNAKQDDVVIIAGKGHETYQILKDKTIHFDDREEAIAAIEEVLA
jgi:UDP-N-acetylmuramoyl-L-alanyl-D-glutamate--2,6-diaminopimelate ligase